MREGRSTADDGTPIGLPPLLIVVIVHSAALLIWSAAHVHVPAVVVPARVHSLHSNDRFCLTRQTETMVYLTRQTETMVYMRLVTLSVCLAGSGPQTTSASAGQPVGASPSGARFH